MIEKSFALKKEIYEALDHEKYQVYGVMDEVQWLKSSTEGLAIIIAVDRMTKHMKKD